MRRVVPLLVLALLLALPAGASASKLFPGGPDAPMRTDRQAARLVHRSDFEPRPENRAANRRRPTAAQLAVIHRIDVPGVDRVTGAFSGTTDEILRWVGYKWRIAPDLLRAVATQESWWRMSAVGVDGHAFGLMQLQRRYYDTPLVRTSTVVNVELYAATLRAYYDGRQTWLEDSPQGSTYRAGDAWGSVGAYYTGRWHVGDEAYVAGVRRHLAQKTWREPGF